MKSIEFSEAELLMIKCMDLRAIAAIAPQGVETHMCTCEKCADLRQQVQQAQAMVAPTPSFSLTLKIVLGALCQLNKQGSNANE